MSNFIAIIRNSFVNWRTRRQTIDALSMLNDHQLRDIGIHRSEIISVATEVASKVKPTRVLAIASSKSAVRSKATVKVSDADIDCHQAA